jgi:hypothetical protein
LVRFGKLNAGGIPDLRNTISATGQDLVSIDVSHSRVFRFGVVEIGAGYESINNKLTGDSVSESRAYVQWRTSY